MSRKVDDSHRSGQRSERLRRSAEVRNRTPLAGVRMRVPLRDFYSAYGFGYEITASRLLFRLCVVLAATFEPPSLG